MNIIEILNINLNYYMNLFRSKLKNVMYFKFLKHVYNIILVYHIM